MSREYLGIFLRGNTYWISYSRNGHEIRESAKTTNVKQAIKLRGQKIEEAKKPEFVGPAEKRKTLEDLERKIEADYIRNERRSLDTVRRCLNHVKEYFPYDRLVDIK